MEKRGSHPGLLSSAKPEWWEKGRVRSFRGAADLGPGEGEGREEPLLASSGARRNRPALPQRSTLTRITAAAFHLLRSAGNRHAPHYFDSHRATNPATDQPTISPRHPQTSLLSLPCTPPSPPAKTTRLPSSHYGFLHQNIPLHLNVRQNSGALRHQVQKGRGTTSTWRTRLLKAN